MDRNHYLFSLNKKTITQPVNSISVAKPYTANNTKVFIQKGLDGQEGAQGPTGSSGKDGDRFCTKTINKISLTPTENSLVIINVEPGLAYISGNSVIVSEVPNSINSNLNTFEGTIQYYNQASGQIVIKDITNIHGYFDREQHYYHVNLDGIDGAPGEQGPPGPTGPSNISETHISLVLLDNTITIPEQINLITYYTINFKNNDELKNIQNNLKNNQTAIISIELSDIYNNDTSTATIFPINNNEIHINYITNIILNQDTPFIMLKIYNINNSIFLESVPYYKNNFIKL
jgi:hypothetical protein